MSPPSGLQLHTFQCRNQTVKILTCETFQGHVLTDDVDLTGFMVWPASHLLCSFLCSRPALLENKTVIELGSGSGLTGILASRFAHQVVLSDMSVPVLSLVENHLEPLDRAKIKCRELLWGDSKHINALLKEFPCGFDVVLGADIVYPGANSFERLSALLDTVAELFGANPDAVFICAYLSRHRDTDVAFANEAVRRRFSWQVIRSPEFVTDGDYFPSILSDACIIQFTAQRGSDYARNFDDMNLPEWSTTRCGRTQALGSSSPESWHEPEDDIFD